MSLPDAHRSTLAALRRAQRALADPALPPDLAEQLSVRLEARARTLVERGSPSRRVVAPVAQAVRPVPAAPAAPTAPKPPTLWQRLGPAFAENLLFVLGAFLLLAGAAYFTSTAWTTMGGSTRLGVVQAGLSALAGLLAGLGWLLNRDRRLDDLEAVLRPVAAAVAGVAVIAAGRLTLLDGLWGALAGAIGVALAGLGAGWAGGPAARLPAIGFAAVAWAAPWLAPWATPILAALGVALALLTRRLGARAAAPVGLTWAIACAHVVVTAGPAWAGLGVALAGAGLAVVQHGSRAAHGFGLALAIGAVPAALADPSAALAAAALGAWGTLRSGLVHRRRALWATGLVLAFAAYLLSPAPLRTALARIRGAVAQDLGYGGGRLPLAWYAVTCLPYLVAVGWALGPARRRDPGLARLTRWWLRFVCVTLLVLAASAVEWRPLAIGWAAVGAVGLAIEAWRRDWGLALLAAPALAAAVGWGGLWLDLGAAPVAAAWAVLAAAAAVVGHRVPQTGLGILRDLATGLAAAATAWATLATVSYGWPPPADGVALTVATAALLAMGLGPWALLGLAGPLLALHAIAPPAALAAAAVGALTVRAVRPEVLVGLAVVAGWPHAGWGWGQAALGGALTVALWRANRSWARAVVGALGPATLGAVAHALGAPPPAVAVVALAAAALGQAVHRWSPPAGDGATVAALAALGALVWLDPAPTTHGPIVVGAALIAGALLTGRGSGAWIWALAGAAGGVFVAAGVQRAWDPDLGLLGAGLALAGAGVVALDGRWAAGRPGGRLTAGLLGVVALGMAGFDPPLAPLALAAVVALGVQAQGRVAGLLVTPAVVGLGLWAAYRFAAPAVVVEGVVLVTMAALLALGTRGLRGLGRRATLLWSAPVALVALNRLLEEAVWRLDGRAAGPALEGLVVVAVALFLWQVGERAPPKARPWTRLAAAVVLVGAWAPITRWLAAAPGHAAPPAYEVLALAALCAWRVRDPWLTRVALAVGLLAVPVALSHPAAAGALGLAAVVAAARAWRAPTAVEVGAALWLGALAAYVCVAAATGRAVTDPSLWPALALVLTAVSALGGHVRMRRWLPRVGDLSAGGAVLAVLAVAIDGDAVGPLAGVALLGAGANGAWRSWAAAAERAVALWGAVAALAVVHAALVQRTGWLDLLGGHHLEVWSALALAAVAFAPGDDLRGRAARRQALLLVLPALLAADDALGVARGASLAALVYAVAGRGGAPWLRRLALAFGNVAVLATWVAVDVVDPVFYGLPPGLTLVAVAELDRARLSAKAHLALLFSGLTLSYGAVAVQALRVGSATHAAGLLGLGLGVVALGWWRKRPALLLGGAAGVVLAPAGHLLRAGFQQGFSGAVLLLVAGVVVLAAAAVAARRRRD